MSIDNSTEEGIGELVVNTWWVIQETLLSLRQPQPQAFSPQPQAFSPQPQAFSPPPPQPQTFSPQPQAFSPQPQAFSPQPQEFSPQPQAFNPRPLTFSPQGSMIRANDPRIGRVLKQRPLDWRPCSKIPLYSIYKKKIALEIIINGVEK
ncbi:hypothetical protein TNCT_83131 [Trichonephila clavata]|uniref:Uncharacterized protein n=1 Tax=Trichonephila clavata TaxID=2740835 RepID=A0A8X6HZW6_TRICU|nr:hypothetical protein TNCT_83131 [Trichonephila clavata]